VHASSKLGAWLEQQGWKRHGSFICANNKAKGPKGIFQIGDKTQQDPKKLKIQKARMVGRQKGIATKRKTHAGKKAIGKKMGICLQTRLQ
jgi:hypothetical protein